MDRINIKNFEVFANHGVFPEENILGQKYIISASLYADLRKAGMSDELDKSIDYNRICRDIKSFIENNTFKLIETVAEGLAAMLLTDNQALDSVWLEVKKPWAPVAVHLETVSVEIERSRHTAYISLGSNMGDMEGQLRFAVSQLKKARGCRVIRVSEFIETAPYGFTEQDDFLNGCLELETLMPPHELLDLLHDIENQAARVRDAHWGPRTLDLDIVFYDDAVISDDKLRVPHADMRNREFVLAPLSEIAPNKLHPVFKKTVSEMLEELRSGM